MENSQKEIVIKNSGPTSPLTAVVIAGGIGVAAYFINDWIKQKKKDSAEAETSTEAGQIATALKIIFDESSPSADEYRRVALRINATNKADVYRIFKDLTGKNLSDELTRLPVESVEKAAKIEAYNSKPGKLFSVSPSNQVTFEIAAGSTIRFAPGQTTPVKFYNLAHGIVLNDIEKSDYIASKKLVEDLKKDPKTVAATVSILVKPNAKAYPVVSVKTLTSENLQKSQGFFYSKVKPWVFTKKQFAAVQIFLGRDKKTNKPILAWVDARDMVTFKPANSVKGMGSIHLIS